MRTPHWNFFEPVQKTHFPNNLNYILIIISLHPSVLEHISNGFSHQNSVCISYFSNLTSDSIWKLINCSGAFAPLFLLGIKMYKRRSVVMKIYLYSIAKLEENPFSGPRFVVCRLIDIGKPFSCESMVMNNLSFTQNTC